MNEEGKKSSPHYGIFPFDPEAGPKIHTAQDQPVGEEQSRERRKLSKKETWYTVQPGVAFKTGPEGSDASDYGGVFSEPTRVRVLGNKVIHNGIASVNAAFEFDGKIRTGWLSFDEIKSQNFPKKKRKTINKQEVGLKDIKTEPAYPVLHIKPGTAYYPALPSSDITKRENFWERLEDAPGGRDLKVAPSSLDENGEIISTPGLKGNYIEILDEKTRPDGNKIVIKRWVPDNRGLETPRRT